MIIPNKILITGGCGYIGAKLLRVLPSETEGVVFRILDNLSSGTYNAIVGLPESGHYQFIEADILNPAQLSYALKDIDIVVHLAAIVNTPLNFENPNWTEQVNNWGTAHLLNACKEAGISQFIYVSSSSVYGPGENKSEDDMLKPLGAYATSKKAAEKYIIDNAGDINYSILRCGTVYGFSPVLRVASFINKFASLAGLRKKITVYGDGEQQRPVIHVGNLCKLVCDIINKPEQYHKNIFNVAEDNYSINDVISVLKEIRPDTNIFYTEQDLRTHYSFGVNSDKIKSTGWEPELSLREGLSELIGNFAGFERVRM